MSNLSVSSNRKGGLKEWTRLRVICWYFNWIVTLTASVVCMIPLIAYGGKQTEGYPSGDFAALQKFSNGTMLNNAQIKAITDDGIWSVSSYQNVLISALNLGIAIPSTMDLMVDIFVDLTEKRGDKSSSQDIVRLSLLERAAFLLGVICNGVYLFFPPSWNIMIVYNVNNVFNNYSAFIQIVPITIFLERSTHAFTPLWTSFLVLTLALSESIWCMTYMGVTHAQFLQMDMVNVVCYGLSTWGTLLTILFCFVKTMRQYRWGSGIGERYNEDGTILSVYEDFNLNQVPALHMIALACSLIVCFVWYYLLAAITFVESNLLNTLFILAACMVMVIEMRVRANEVREGLDKIELVQELAAKEAAVQRSAHRMEKAAKEIEKSGKEREQAAKEREMQLTLELQENIANSAHDIKSPTCALSLAVDSLLDSFHGKTRIDKDGCTMTIETLKGMMHTLSSLNMIINRSVDSARKSSGKNLIPNVGLIEIHKLMDDVIVFMRWQAEGSSLVVTLEPLPAHLPTDILADLRWLREDLMCVAANALKFSRERSMVPVIVRLTIDADNDGMKPMLCFSFIDSGYNLSKDRLLNLFDHPKMLSDERMGTGGMGLGMYCLRERVTTLGGRYGAKVRSDGLEGTEIWFSIPLLTADDSVKTFELQHHSHTKSHTTPQDALDQREIEVTGKNDAVFGASLAPTGRTSNATEFVMALGGSRRSSSSAPHRSSFYVDGSFVSSKTNAPNRGMLGAKDSDGARTPVSNKGAYSALVSNKTIKSSTDTLLELGKSTDASSVASRRPSSLGRVSEDIGGMTLPILIVDDSIAILKMTKRSINNELPDLVIKEARDGNEAFDRVKGELHGFHVIISDIQMPGCDGFEFTRRVREFENQNGTPPTIIIGISANYQEKIIKESQTCGMDGFMHKPFLLQTLLDLINHVQFRRDLTKKIGGLLLMESPDSCDSQGKDWKAATSMPTEGSADVLSPTVSGAQPDMVPPLSSEHHSMPVIAMSSATNTITAHTTTSHSDMSTTTVRTNRSLMEGIGNAVIDNAVDKQVLQSSTEAPVAEQDLALPLKNVRVLVVDDSVPILKMMSMTLVKRGKALITQAKDGLEAVNHCESVVATGGQDFSVILTDIQMPNLDGMGVARRVRAMEKELCLEPKIIVGISAYSGDRIGIEAMEAGMDAFLAKPFKYETFESTVQDILQRRKNVAEQVIEIEKDIVAVQDSASELKPVIVIPTGSKRVVPEA